jgi:flagellar biosynthetic protein FliQ
MIDMHMVSALQDMLYYTLAAVFLLTLPVLVVGIAISILQAATQINEITMTFIPKLVVMFTVLYASAPYLMTRLVQLTQKLMHDLPIYIR